MTELDKDYQSAQEMGRIYYSLTDREVLCGFFLDSLSKYVDAAQGFLFLAGKDGLTWLAANTDPSKPPPDGIESKGQQHLRKGKPEAEDGVLYLPLIARNSALGVACFLAKPGAAFSSKHVDLAFGLASQMSGALKNLLLFEENLKMENLAAVGRTISMVLHEIKNIMMIARLANELIKLGMTEKDEHYLQRGFDEMSKVLREMDGFVWEMLNLTKDHKIVTQKVKLDGILEELKGDLSAKAKDRNAELEFQVDGNLGEVDIDRRAIYRTLLNLVKNSLEACNKDQSHVRIQARSLDEKYYELSIEDNGMGMNAEAKAKIFQAFFSTKGDAGTGLGLLIIDQTIKKHKGEIRVESELGKGTTFTLKLPKSIPNR